MSYIINILIWISDIFSSPIYHLIILLNNILEEFSLGNNILNILIMYVDDWNACSSEFLL